MPLLTSTVPILLGPTAVGKTETSLLQAERINGEIVNYDALEGRLARLLDELRHGDRA